MDLKEGKLLHKLALSSKFPQILIGLIILTTILGIGTGYFLSQTNKSSSTNLSDNTTEKVKNPQRDAKTFRDFAQGKLEKKPEPKNGVEYSEGTHLLVRENAVPVALTSSVVDLSLYEGKNVKVFGETQKAIKEGWLMDVGKVEEIK